MQLLEVFLNSLGGRRIALRHIASPRVGQTCIVYIFVLFIEGRLTILCILQWFSSCILTMTCNVMVVITVSFSKLQKCCEDYHQKPQTKQLELMQMALLPTTCLKYVLSVGYNYMNK